MTRRHALDHRRLPQYLDRLLHAAIVMTGSRHDAEDLVQETFVRVMQRPRLVHQSDYLGYLLRTMRHTWFAACRRRRAEARAVAASAALLERRHDTDPLLPVEARALLEAVAALPGAQRDAIAAVDVLGLSCEQAARALGTREGTVMSRLFRGRLRVGEALAD